MGSKPVLLSSNVMLFFCDSYLSDEPNCKLVKKTGTECCLSALIMIQYTFAYLDCLKN
jgi:hypothetical protein